MDHAVVDSDNVARFEVTKQDHFVADVVVFGLVLQGRWGEAGLALCYHFVVANGDCLRVERKVSELWDGVVDLN